ncbi:MAG: di-trans,poly-cis-decaprenylcistransferase [Candidatus Aenigmarchaeota archaeon]|nr:di-trans,poly-cis-decaprenylcistransferase [Candidatus Aenigmarchaeota archaeon]
MFMNSRVPLHIGVILDGNRRFAKQLLQKPWMGHKWGLQKAREVLEWACEGGIKYLTAYVLSLENLKTRPKRELEFIFNHLEKEAHNILNEKDHVIHRFKVNVRFIGRTHLLPSRLQRKLMDVERATKNYKKHFLNVAVAYGGQQEIVDAVRKLMLKSMKGLLKPHQLDEALLKKHLYTDGQPYPDMIVRTGGDIRLSNFLPFQSVYSELLFTEKKWPEITKEDFNGFIREFQNRKRKFGR